MYAPYYCRKGDGYSGETIKYLGCLSNSRYIWIVPGTLDLDD
jgi:hypothetical protein